MTPTDIPPKHNSKAFPWAVPGLRQVSLEKRNVISPHAVQWHVYAECIHVWSWITRISNKGREGKLQQKTVDTVPNFVNATDFSNTTLIKPHRIILVSPNVMVRRPGTSYSHGMFAMPIQFTAEQR